jgi:hypothetical protein
MYGKVNPLDRQQPLSEAGTVKLTEATNIYDAFSMFGARIAELDAEVKRLKDDTDVLSEHFALSVKDVNKLLKKQRKIRRKVLCEVRKLIKNEGYSDGSTVVQAVDKLIEEGKQK